MAIDLEAISPAMENGNKERETQATGNTEGTTQGKTAPSARTIPMKGNIRKTGQPRLSAVASELERNKDCFEATAELDKESFKEEDDNTGKGKDTSNGKPKKMGGGKPFHPKVEA
ncbi:hypothetical protein PCASD_07559 [Puccinia coronata f. sp. avenae]|uniref:Uncharacterized protein n=1 Tax=Puccinia coronata f. sp. avenae TaxID=200324 RepID=A0A2N5TGT9_9BASI|nr:hypothetical protein PCASD_07559 [Puccinia coronata f. sp. avenae]